MKRLCALTVFASLLVACSGGDELGPGDSSDAASDSTAPDATLSADGAAPDDAHASDATDATRADGSDATTSDAAIDAMDASDASSTIDAADSGGDAGLGDATADAPDTAPLTIMIGLDGGGDANVIDPTFGEAGVVTVPLTQLADGSVPYATIVSVVVRPDGRIAALLELSIGNVSWQTVVQVDGAGLDPTFGAGGVATLPQLNYPFPMVATPGLLALQDDGKLLVGATHRFPLDDGGVAYAGSVVRLTADGALDPAFGDAGMAGSPAAASLGAPYAAGVAAGPQGSIVFAATVIDHSNAERLFLERLSSTGALDTSFAGSGFALSPFGAPQRIVLQEVGRIVSIPVLVSALDAVADDGGADPTFGAGSGSDAAPGAVTLPWGANSVSMTLELLDAGALRAYAILPDPIATSAASQRTRNGDPDLSFGNRGEVRLVAASGDARTIGAARFRSNDYLGVAALGRALLVKVRDDGSLDPTWGAGGVAVAPLSDGTTVPFVSAGAGALVVAIVRYNAQSQLEIAFARVLP